MIDITKLSTRYNVYKLDDSDVDRILELCKGNPQYYRYTEAEPEREEILKTEIAYIGFFMMNIRYQGEQIGTAIVDEVQNYLKSTGKAAIRLGIDKGNPQSTYFWRKNGFEMVSEVDVNGWTKIVAEKQLV